MQFSRVFNVIFNIITLAAMMLVRELLKFLEEVPENISQRIYSKMQQVLILTAEQNRLKNPHPFTLVEIGLLKYRWKRNKQGRKYKWQCAAAPSSFPAMESAGFQLPHASMMPGRCQSTLGTLWVCFAFVQGIHMVQFPSQSCLSLMVQSSQKKSH